jgi:hypothetical protein
MAAFTLRGPYRLMSDVIRTFVPQGVPGVFVLGPISPGRANPVDAVGRADHDLAAALIDLVGSNSGFMFTAASSVAEAFGMECALFHENLLAGRRPHPVAPSNTFLPCPLCGDQARS